MNCEYRKKNITNLVFITDENKLPLSYYCNKIKEIKPYGRTTLEHENKSVQPLLDKIKSTIPTRANVNLIGDKGFINSIQYRIQNKDVNLITPKRRNQIRRNTDEEKKLLKIRIKIEHFNSSFKSCDRLNIRKDRQILTYLGFVNIFLIDYYFKYNSKNCTDDIHTLIY